MRKCSNRKDVKPVGLFPRLGLGLEWLNITCSLKTLSLLTGLDNKLNYTATLWRRLAMHQLDLSDIQQHILPLKAGWTDWTHTHTHSECFINHNTGPHCSSWHSLYLVRWRKSSTASCHAWHLWSPSSCWQVVLPLGALSGNQGA